MTVNSAAVRNPSLIDAIAAKYGSQFIVAAIDARQVDGRWVVTTPAASAPPNANSSVGPQRPSSAAPGDSLHLDGPRRHEERLPLRDLRAAGPELPVPIIASGGAGTVDHIAEVLTRGRADAALAASIFHYDEIPIPVLKRALNQRGIPVRL